MNYKYFLIILTYLIININLKNNNLYNTRNQSINKLARMHTSNIKLAVGILNLCE